MLIKVTEKLIGMQLKLNKLLKEERGEGMVGWIAAAVLTVAIVVALNLAMDGFVSDFWTEAENKIMDIIR